jgi:hypothetical protein
LFSGGYRDIDAGIMTGEMLGWNFALAIVTISVSRSDNFCQFNTLGE